MLFAHLKRILRMARLQLRGPCGARDEFLLAATAQKAGKAQAAVPPSRRTSAVMGSSTARTSHRGYGQPGETLSTSPLSP
ncbi:transposase (plasmid) [Sinorhizobium americanum CCGM7]|nr:transposase [Sinorhizobium americanum CCGM7]